jgi:hypothetical protein
MMVPIYAIESFLGMTIRRYDLGFSVMRECYESLALYSFFQYLVVCLGGKSVLADNLRSKPPVQHLWPFQHMKPWTMGPVFLRMNSVRPRGVFCVLCAALWLTTVPVVRQVGILQYVPVKLLCSLISLITGVLGCYGAGQFEVHGVCFRLV